MTKEIPVYKLDTGSYLDFAVANLENIRKMLDNWLSTAGGKANFFVKCLLPTSDNIVKRWLTTSEHPFRSEILAINELINRPGYLTISFGFNWGCTVKIDNQHNFFRALDWNFPHLGHFLQVVHHTHKLPYYAPTWPGLTGLYQVIAPDRFCISINQAPMPTKPSRPTWLSWLINRKNTFTVTDDTPARIDPAHLLRQIAEDCLNYDTAIQLLANTPLNIPCVFSILGPAPGQGAVIERTESNHHTFKLTEHKQLVAANHFTGLNQNSQYIWQARGFDNQKRIEDGRSLDLSQTAPKDLNTLYQKLTYPIINPDTKVLLLTNLQDIAILALDDQQQVIGQWIRPSEPSNE